MAFSGLVRLGLWLIARAAIYLVLVVTFAVWQRFTGKQYLSDTFGLQFGFGLPLLLFVMNLLSGIVWLITGVAARTSADRRVGTMGICAALEALITAGQLMLLFPASVPFVALSLVSGAAAAWLLVWAHRRRSS